MNEPSAPVIRSGHEWLETFVTHRGRMVWANGAEMQWECDDDCPHLGHDDGNTLAATEPWQPDNEPRGTT